MDMNLKQALMNLISKMGGKGGELDVEMSMDGGMLGNSPDMATSEGDKMPESPDKAPSIDMGSIMGGGPMGRAPNSLRERAMASMKGKQQ